MNRSNTIPQYAVWSIARPSFLAMTETVGRLAWRTVARLVQWRERARQRHVLVSLTDRELRDIGITRLDVWREVSKPFWQE